MFASTFVVALVGASAASAATIVARTSGASIAVPSTYTQPWLEPYAEYHARYLALNCEDKHNTKFFDACCHPMLKWETLSKARPDYCVPSASTAVASPTTHVQIVSHSSSAAASATATAGSDDGEDCDDDEDDDDEEDCDDEDDNTGADNNTGATNNNGGDDEEECEEGTEDCVCEDEPETSTAAASSATSQAASSTKTRSTVKVTSTVTASSTSVAATSSPAVTSTASSTVKTSSSSTKTSSSSSASSTSSTKTSSSVASTTSATSTKTTATSTKTTQTTSSTPKASSAPSGDLTKVDTGSYSGGVGTFYYQGGVAGACGNFHGDDSLIAAIDFRRYGNTGEVSKLCGKKLKITNDKNGKSVTVSVQDACPTCNNANSVDLSKGAFLQIATEEEGEVPISVTFV